MEHSLSVSSPTDSVDSSTTPPISLQNHCLYVLLNDLHDGRYHWAFYIPELVPTSSTNGNATPSQSLTIPSSSPYHYTTGMRRGDIFHVTNYLATQPWTVELGISLPKSSFDSDATLILAVKIADFTSEGGLGRHSWNRRRFIQCLERIQIGEECFYGQEAFSGATWAEEVVRRLSSPEAMGPDGPALVCENPREWREEVMAWAVEARETCAGVRGSVAIKESTKCRVWRSRPVNNKGKNVVGR